MTPTDHHFLQRAIQLAQLAGSQTRTNPLVGAVLVKDGRIIGEGWHKAYGGPHAEVEAVNSVAHPEQLAGSTLYVTLEPCCHQGKTPPCTSLILKHGIQRVVVGITDPNPQVAGKGIALLQAQGVEVVLAPDPAPFRHLARHFLVNQLHQRPYVHLKWAQCANGYMGKRGEHLAITGEVAQRWTHQQRGQHQAILVGWQTLLADNPRLDVRWGLGRAPEVILLSPDGSLPPKLALHNTAPHIWVVNPRHGGGPEGKLSFIRLPFSLDGQVDIALLWRALLDKGIGSVLVEGGAQLHASILASGLYDEVSVLTGAANLQADIPAPQLPTSLGAAHTHTKLGADELRRWVVFQ